MLGQQNKQYEWHPLIDDKYLNANGYKHYIKDLPTKILIYEFDRSKSIRLDELLDSLQLLRLHAGQAIYLMIQIIAYYIQLEQQNLQPKFISTKNIWIILEYGSENFKLVFVSPLKYKICFTYSSEEGNIQLVLNQIISKLPLCQSSTDYKAIDSDRNKIRNQLINQLNQIIQADKLDKILEQMTQLLKQYNYTKFESFQNFDSAQYGGICRRKNRIKDVEKIYNKFSNLTYGFTYTNISWLESQHIEQMRGFFIQHAIFEARQALVTELSSITFSEANIPIAFNNAFITSTLAKFHYKSRCFKYIYDSFIEQAQTQMIDVLTRNLVLNEFGMKQVDYQAFIESIKKVHDDACQTYLRLKGYYNSIMDFTKFPPDVELEAIEKELFDKYIVPILLDKIKSFLNKQFSLFLLELDNMHPEVNK